MTNKMAKKAMGLKGFMNSMSKPKMKKGGFPDLNKDGEITKADILMGRGVIKKPSMQMGGMPMGPKVTEKRKTVTTLPSGDYKLVQKYKETPREHSVSTKTKRTAKGFISGAPKASKLTRQMQPDMYYENEKTPQMMKKGGMNIKKETLKNATPSIPNSYYQMGGMKEENPLSGMLKESMKEKAMAKKKAMAKPMPKGKGKKKMQLGGRFMPGLPVATATEGKDFENKQSFKKGGMAKKKK